MNFPAANRRALQQLRQYAEEWQAVPTTHEAGKQALKMEAALRMVLLFHGGGEWDAERRQEWNCLQVAAGRDSRGDATTRTLCDTIREVLGIE